MKKRRNQPEDALQKCIADYLDMALPADAVFYAVENGKDRSKAEAGILKGMGVKPGVPDIHILWRARIVYIELKSAKGSLSKAQEVMRDRLLAAGAGAWTEARSLDDVIAFLSGLGMPLRARAAA